MIDPARPEPAEPCPGKATRPALTLVPALPGTAGPTTADAEAMTELWHRHGDSLLRFALKLTRGDQHRAEDIVQETLVRAWRHPEVVRGGKGAIRAWLFTVTRHVAIDMWRARSRADETIDDWQTDRPDPAEPIEQVVTAMEVQAALSQLTPQQRDVVVAMYFHGRSTAEIAESLGIPVGTVKSRVHYGLRRLRELLSAEPGRPAEPVTPASPAAPASTVRWAGTGQRQIPA